MTALLVWLPPRVRVPPRWRLVTLAPPTRPTTLPRRHYSAKRRRAPTQPTNPATQPTSSQSRFSSVTLPRQSSVKLLPLSTPLAALAVPLRRAAAAQIYWEASPPVGSVLRVLSSDIPTAALPRAKRATCPAVNPPHESRSTHGTNPHAAAGGGASGGARHAGRAAAGEAAEGGAAAGGCWPTVRPARLPRLSPHAFPVRESQTNKTKPERCCARREKALVSY